MKAIHLLAKHGARWRPCDKRATNAARRSLLKMKPDYTLEFVWIMQKYGGCSRSDIESLIKTPTIKRHLSEQIGRVREMVGLWPDETLSSND